MCGARLCDLKGATAKFWPVNDLASVFAPPRQAEAARLPLYYDGPIYNDLGFNWDLQLRCLGLRTRPLLRHPVPAPQLPVCVCGPPFLGAPCLRQRTRSEEWPLKSDVCGLYSLPVWVLGWLVRGLAQGRLLSKSLPFRA